MSTFKIALVQHKAVPNDIDANLRLALRYINEASYRGADLVLFPEMWSNGYAPPFDDAFDEPLRLGYDKERAKWLQNAVALDSDYVMSLKDMAGKLHIGIAATFLSDSFSNIQNTAIIIDRDGEVILNYAKVHTCDFSLECLLKSGTEFKVCEFDGIKIGIMICFDREFPESARILMLKGAEIVLVPNACDMNPARINQLSTRAFENMIGIAMANYPGKNWGNSCAFSPVVFDHEGKWTDPTIVCTNDMQEHIVIAEFNLDKIREYRKNEVWGNAYRKTQAYADMLN